jgi:hypothetical protein
MTDITFEFATMDDCLDRLVPSDLRLLVSERDQLKLDKASMQEEIDESRKTLDSWEDLLWEYRMKCDQLQAEVEALKAGSQWISSDVLPKDSSPVYVTQHRTYRFLRYKQNSQQFKKGIEGRWQKFNGYGFDNCDAPVEYSIEPPKTKE